jgi:lipopolysaccharide export system permease protein
VRLLDRYLLREFVTLLLLSLLSFVVIFAVVDLFEKIQDFLDGHASAWTIGRYYFYKIPYVVVTVLPVALLMATFLSLGQMSKFNELTAIVTAGVSTGRVVLPLFGVALVAVLVSFALSEAVVPDATRKRDAIFEREVQRRPAPGQGDFTNVSFLGNDGRVYLVRLYLSREQRMHDVLVTELREGAIARRIDAQMARWDGRRWVFQNGVVRTFRGGSERAEPFRERAFPELRERPEDFRKDSERPDEMGYFELADYVRKLRRSGLRADKYDVDLQLKLALPFINLIVVVLGTALATRLRHANAAVGFGISVSVAFLYYGIMRAAEALGEAGSVSPVVAGWAGNALLGVIAFLLFAQAQRR